jgi:hypothetical protein
MHNGEVTSTALAQYEHGGQVPTTAGGGVPAIRETMEALKAVRTFIKQEFKAGQDYGIIPGTGVKNTLLLPGAQKACMYFNAYPEFQVTTHEYGNGHAEYQVTAVLVSRTTGMRVGSGVGLCSTMESKYRFRNAAKTCPDCGKETIIRGKSEYGGGWLCYGKKGGCGAKFSDGNPTIESQAAGQIENANPHDTRNTALKMGKKRALVDASMGLGCLSEIFTQDLEDTYDLHATPVHDDDAQPAQREAPAQRPERPSSATPPRQEAHKGQDDTCPKNGRGLFAWIKKKEDAFGAGLLKAVDTWAKAEGLPYKMIEWNEDEVRAGYTKAAELLGPGRFRDPSLSPAPAPVGPDDGDDLGDDIEEPPF